MIAVQLNSSYVQYNDHPNAFNRGHWLRDDVYEWLRANVGIGERGGGWSEGFQNDWVWTFSNEQSNPLSGFLRVRPSHIIFNNPDHAVLFKLTWGGS